MNFCIFLREFFKLIRISLCIMVRKIITYSSYGAKAYISSKDAMTICEKVSYLEIFLRELKAFYRYFWGNSHEDWRGVNVPYLQFFDDKEFLKPVED